MQYFFFEYLAKIIRSLPLKPPFCKLNTSFTPKFYQYVARQTAFNKFNKKDIPNFILKQTVIFN